MRLVHGIGINDADYVVQVKETVGYVDGTQKQKLIWLCPFYSTWKSMLRRAYSNKYKENRPTYQEVSVCQEWLTFSKFKAWMETQDWEGKQLDKDILVEWNKLYSPETCVFVSGNVNSFILNTEACRGEYPIGVCWDKQKRKFRAQISKLKGKQRFIGYFDTQQEAHLAWAKAKRELLEQLIIEENLEIRIANALRMKYAAILRNAQSQLEGEKSEIR